MVISATFQGDVNPGIVLHDYPSMMLGADPLGPPLHTPLWETAAPPVTNPTRIYLTGFRRDAWR